MKSHDDDKRRVAKSISRSSLSNELVNDAQQKFETFSGRSLSEHDAREALGNLADFVNLLIEWDRSPIRNSD